MTRVPLSILDLVPVAEGRSVKEGIERSMRGAELADKLGYARYWFAEHHNTANLAASATSILIDQALTRTERIRVGSGGVMLPNHSPLVVAETFGTLANIHGDRIDLGLGRAPGTDPVTAQLLNRTPADPQSFATAIHHMQGWFGDSGHPDTIPVSSGVSAGTNVPMWVLGSTTNGASIAAQLGLSFSIASHFAPDQMEAAIETYRSQFTDDVVTAQIDSPKVMVAVNVTVADTDEEAEHLFSTHQQMMLSVRTGKRVAMQPPRALREFTDTTSKIFIDSLLRVRAVGSPETVAAQLEKLQRRTGADEFILNSYIYDDDAWLKNLDLLAKAWI